MLRVLLTGGGTGGHVNPAIAIADTIQEIKTVCWCGRKATCNARFNSAGIVRDGEQVMLGANDNYVALCRKHFKLGMLGPDIDQN